MKFQKSKLARLSVSLGLVTVMGISAALPAFAAGPEPTVTLTGATDVTGGAVTVKTNFGTAGTILLTGVDQTGTISFAVGDMIDARGTGLGWKLSMTLPQFKDTGYTTGDLTAKNSLATSSLKVAAIDGVLLAGGKPTVVRATGADSSSDPADIVKVSNEIPLDTGFAVTLLSAATDKGMGSYKIGDITATLTIPANVYELTYKSTSTVEIAQTP